MAGLESIGQIANRMYPDTERLLRKNSSEASGDPSSEIDPATGKPYECLLCRDSHFVYPKRQDGGVDYSRIVTCQCIKERWEKERAERYRRFCRIPASLEKCTFDNYSTHSPKLKEALAAARELAEGIDKFHWLTMVGLWDRGKTHLAVCIAKRWLERGLLARFAPVPELLDELRSCFDKDPEFSYRQMVEMICKVPLLVLDDLGMERQTEWTQETLETIINRRSNEGMALVVTTNRPFWDAEADRRKVPCLTPRISSRLQRYQPGRVIVLDCPEYRVWKNKS